MWQFLAGLARYLPAEAAHKLAVEALRWKMGPRPAPNNGLADLGVSLAGLEFPNPLGLAAGFDKNAACFEGALRLGFGHVEVGTITPLPQAGNPKPRVFRLPNGARKRFSAGGVCFRRRCAHPPACWHIMRVFQ